MSAARAARVAARVFGDLGATLPRQACNNEGKGPLFFLTLNCKPKVLFVDMTKRADVGLDLYTGKMVTPEAGVIERPLPRVKLLMWYRIGWSLQA